MPPSADPVPLELSARGRELLDDPRADRAAVEESLRNIALANRWFGGTAAVRWGLARLLAGVREGASLTLLDLGTGAGDIPLAAARYAARRGIRLVPLGLERSPVAARLAGRAGVACVVGDAGALPFGPGRADIVLLSQVAHHFSADSVVSLLRSCNRLARHGVIVADLRRSPAARAAFAVGARLLRFDRVTCADGHTSIRRGYAASELTALLARAGIGARAVRRPWWRLVAAWRTGA